MTAFTLGRLSTATLCTTLLALPGAATAKPMHMSVQVKATACGATITCAAKSDSSSYGKAIVGLVPAANIRRVTRDSARQTLARTSVSTPYGRAVPVTINVTYGKEFKAGDQFHVVSAWPYGSSAHVWGAVTTTSPANLVTLPKATGRPRATAAKGQGAKGTAAKGTGETLAVRRAKVTALRQTQRAKVATLKTQHKDATAKLKTTHATQAQRLKTTAQARRAKLQAKVAAAPDAAKKTAARAMVAQDTKRTQADARALKAKQKTAIDALSTKQKTAIGTLDTRHQTALSALQTKLGV